MSFKVFEKLINREDLEHSRTLTSDLNPTLQTLREEYFKAAAKDPTLYNELKSYLSALLSKFKEDIKSKDEKRKSSARAKGKGVAVDKPNNKALARTQEGPVNDRHVSGVKRSRPKPSLPDNIKTVDFDGHEYQINTNFWYEAEDIAYALKARLNETGWIYNGVPVTLATAFGNSEISTLADTLNGDKIYHTNMPVIKARMLLIPYNPNNYHWVGLLLQFNESGDCTRAEYIESMKGDSVPADLSKSLENIYPGVKLEFKKGLYQQSDSFSCGPYAVENLLLSATNTKVLPRPMPVEEIRAKHLHLIHMQSEHPSALHLFKPIPSTYKSFYNRQLNDIHTVSRSDRSKPASEIPKNALTFGANITSGTPKPSHEVESPSAKRPRIEVETTAQRPEPQHFGADGSSDASSPTAPDIVDVEATQKEDIVMCN